MIPGVITGRCKGIYYQQTFILTLWLQDNSFWKMFMLFDTQHFIFGTKNRGFKLENIHLNCRETQYCDYSVIPWQRLQISWLQEGNLGSISNLLSALGQRMMDNQVISLTFFSPPPMMGRVIYQTEPQVWGNIGQCNHLWSRKGKEEEDRGQR